MTAVAWQKDGDFGEVVVFHVRHGLAVRVEYPDDAEMGADLGVADEVAVNDLGRQVAYVAMNSVA